MCRQINFPLERHFVVKVYENRIGKIKATLLNRNKYFMKLREYLGPGLRPHVGEVTLGAEEEKPLLAERLLGKQKKLDT